VVGPRGLGRLGSVGSLAGRHHQTRRMSTAVPKRANRTSEVHGLERTLFRRKRQIGAWYPTHVTEGPTEAMSNLIKRVKLAAFGFRSFRNYRIRVLLYAGKPNWLLFTTITPH